ncbi:hypothetical protein QFZ56_007841 [Streptomyces achromogenes]|uniref:Uncharacterized protein n=1 Tax=Streptomyces achromogenes TaxID=67255 RepID=A0ABU0QDY8_STRAH|nr:hypothetical protein [Streptomyces achromogenes]
MRRQCIRIVLHSAGQLPVELVQSRYTVDSTSTTATHGATNAIGACNHQPATAHAIQAASAALPACTIRSRSRPGSAHARRTARQAAPP